MCEKGGQRQCLRARCERDEHLEAGIRGGEREVGRGEDTRQKDGGGDRQGKEALV